MVQLTRYVIHKASDKYSTKQCELLENLDRLKLPYRYFPWNRSLPWAFLECMRANCLETIASSDLSWGKHSFVMSLTPTHISTRLLSPFISSMCRMWTLTAYLGVKLTDNEQCCMTLRAGFLVTRNDQLRKNGSVDSLCYPQSLHMEWSVKIWETLAGWWFLSIVAYVFGTIN